MNKYTHKHGYVCVCVCMIYGHRETIWTHAVAIEKARVMESNRERCLSDVVSVTAVIRSRMR